MTKRKVLRVPFFYKLRGFRFSYFLEPSGWPSPPWHFLKNGLYWEMISSVPERQWRVESISHFLQKKDRERTCNWTILILFSYIFIIAFIYMILRLFFTVFYCASAHIRHYARKNILRLEYFFPKPAFFPFSTCSQPFPFVSYIYSSTHIYIYIFRPLHAVFYCASFDTRQVEGLVSS